MAERARSSKSKIKSKAKPPKGAQGSRGKVAKTDPKPGAGHNSGQVSAALVLDHHTKISAIEVRMDKAKDAYNKIKGEHRAAFAVLKQDGINVDDFKLARELDSRDHGSVVTGYANTGFYLQAMKSQLATQLDLFQDMAPPPAGDAKLAGAHAFANGEPRANNPHLQGTDLYEMWDEGYTEKGNATPLVDGEGATIN